MPKTKLPKKMWAKPRKAKVRFTVKQNRDGTQTVTAKWEERHLQEAVARQLDFLAATDRFFWCHVPNGGKRQLSVAVQLKKEGQKAGWPDVQIFSGKAPQRPICVIFIELKLDTNDLSDNQIIVKNTMDRHGFPYYTVKAATPEICVAKVRAILEENGLINGEKDQNGETEQIVGDA